MAIFYSFRLETPQTWRARSPGTGWPSYTPKQWVSSLSPPTTRRTTVGVFETASTREAYSCQKSKLLCDCRFTANRFILALSLLGLTTRDVFHMNSCGHSPYVTSSLTRRWVLSHINILLFAFVKCTYRTYSILLKSLTFALYTSPLSVRALQSRSCLSYVSDATTTA
jgi:hypothetical protein